MADPDEESDSEVLSTDSEEAREEEGEWRHDEEQPIENGYQRGDEPEAIPLPRVFNLGAILLRGQWARGVRDRAFLEHESSSSSSSSSDDEQPIHEPLHINVQDVASHEYLFSRRSRRREGRIGEVLELPAPSEIMLPEMIMELPMLRISEDSFPMPNQRIPLLLYHPNDIATTKFAVAHHFYLAAFPTQSLHSEAMMPTPSDVGVLLQIDRSCDGGLRGYRVHAIGRDRIKLLEEIRNIDSSLSARVQILPEDLLPPLQLSLVPNRVKSHTKTQQRKIAEKIYNIPRWVMHTYSTETKAKTLLNFIRSWSASPDAQAKCEETFDKGLKEFSFFIAANIPVDMHVKLALLRENSVDRRIDMMTEKLFKKMDVVCVSCKTAIARAEDIFSLTVDGNSRHFVNNHGFVHEIITTYDAQHFEFRGPPEASFSWFEGYKWQIIECTMCMEHLGWQYTSKKYEPKSFFGLTRRSVALRERKNNEPESSENRPPSLSENN